ncbi:sugar kinase [Methylophilales bacterium MBRSG12]|uniref:Sugar kinase n=1 Tax=Methylophilales bacterium MBRS-H7 TaxID=1623450 RepID=A0A0H4J0F5_9PROT|nr:sugar kinase [Methylophilales bacterium MBRSF5]AKO65540.1 sugar kinase [Methylophilales bacterium MBRS-H7]AKO66860.1 sugar kinase [Methylophilales bacterium MBRSG12]
MSILVCGSMAYDSIMVFRDYFKNHIMPDQIHKLSVAFYTPEMEKNFGGTAGNIGHNLNLLKTNFFIMSTVGTDFDTYSDWLQKRKINTKYIKKLSDQFTAQAFITTDLDDNQITAFHPGAMTQSEVNSLSDISENIEIILISPDGKEGMIKHANEAYNKKIPFIFDPGQGLPMFNEQELKDFIEKATYITVNDYEAELLSKNSHMSLDEIQKKVDALIITKGSSGSTIMTSSDKIQIPAFNVENPVDPTGCGDAYRAGIAIGIVNNWDWEKSGKLASALASLKVNHKGGQNHNPSIDEIQSLAGFNIN